MSQFPDREARELAAAEQWFAIEAWKRRVILDLARERLLLDERGCVSMDTFLQLLAEIEGRGNAA